MASIYTLDKAFASGNTIILPELDKLGTVDAKLARCKVGSENCPWNPYFEILWGAWKCGETVDLARGGRLRGGVSACLCTEKGIVLGRFKDHPTQGSKWTPPAELWEKGTPLEGALSGLAQEVIISRDGMVGFWSYNGSVLQEEWVRRYASDHGMEVDEDHVVAVQLINMSNDIQILLGGETCGKALVTAEFNTGSLEMIFGFEPVFSTALSGVTLLDGEWIDFSSEWRESEVGFLNENTAATILAECTTKVQAIADNFGYH